MFPTSNVECKRDCQKLSIERMVIPICFEIPKCEKNMQLKCISVFGTASLLRGSGGSPCHVTKLVDCMSKEKVKKECVVDDRGTVYYIDAFLRNVDKTKCMDDFDFAEVQHLFQTSSIKNIHEYSNAHRTFSSGEHISSVDHQDDNEVGDDEDYNSDSGSGSA
ncbi:uncharacterized protein LOC135691539 isoform X2 [Rhopilema esculentum]|uniref:uncharacterized protein LOC135691539 isoform X2 n=1 Tax=Rhopilema esculentum TaxID=499914 RepID=UPI0031D1D340